MYVRTVKIKSALRILIGILIAAAVIFAAVYAVNRLLKPSAITLETKEDMLDFLHSQGWETSEEPISCREAVIPTEWNDVYTKYNELQLAQGFDLSKHRGETVMIYTYAVLNYEGQPDNMVANLVISGGKLIGADVSCTELGGFMQGIARAEG